MIKISFLGGVGEFGKNLTVYDQDGKILIVDAGSMFPENIPGIDLVIPDFGCLEGRADDICGLALTHGHEDHIGAAPFLLERFPAPVWGTRFTLGLLEKKLSEVAVTPPGKTEITAGKIYPIGPFRVEAVPVTHSIPDAVSLVIRTKDGTFVHSGDFKFDQSPLDGRLTHYKRFQEVGDEGVTAVLMDSTNSGVEGISGSERKVIDSLDRYFAEQGGKLIIALFSTNLLRIQALYSLAARHGKKIALFGRSMLANSKIASELGILRVPEGVSIALEDADEYPPEKVVLLVTGSQGEPMAALSRVVFDQSKYVSIEEGDRVLVSARIIPGNEKRVGRILNQVYRKGGEVVTVDEDRIHVSGHAYQEEIKLLATWLRPRYYVPVHGEYRQLMGNAALARQVGMDRDHILMCEDGDTLCFEEGIFINREQVPVGSQLIDGDSRDPVDRVVVRDRRYLSSGGVVVPVVVINCQAGVMEGDPEIISRGYSFLETDVAAAEEVKADIRAMIGALEREEIRDATILKAKLKSRVKKTLKRNEQGIPLIIPVVMEI